MADTLVKMAADSRYTDLVEPYAVAARDAGRAADFATKYGFPVSYGSYEELVSDPNVDLVYIATPHNLHAEQAILCMKAGKGVLVEKAFGANAAQTREMSVSYTHLLAHPTVPYFLQYGHCVQTVVKAKPMDERHR